MKESILKNKRILMVDDEPDVLETLETEIRDACGSCLIEKNTTYETAVQLINSNDYDLVILDIMGVRGFDLLEAAVKRDFLVVMLTAHSLNPESLKRARNMRARAYIPKDKLGEIVPFLEDVFEYDFEHGWKRLRYKLESLLPDRYWDYY